MTDSAKSALGKAVKELTDAGADPEDVRLRAKTFRQMYPKARLTAQALAKHWPTLNGNLPSPGKCFGYLENGTRVELGPNDWIQGNHVIGSG